MSYSADIANLVADQLSRFVTLNRHQLAGQVANFDFWLEQTRHAFRVVDGYGQRFHKLKTAQVKHVVEHHTTAFSLEGPSCPCCNQEQPSPPKKVPASELKEARAKLFDASRRFLARCYKEGLIEEARLEKACAELGIGIDEKDLKPSGTNRLLDFEHGGS